MLKWSKLSEYKIRKVVECFSLDLTATQTAALLRLNRKTVNALYQRFRLLITWQRMNHPTNSSADSLALPLNLLNGLILIPSFLGRAFVLSLAAARGVNKSSWRTANR